MTKRIVNKLFEEFNMTTGELLSSRREKLKQTNIVYRKSKAHCKSLLEILQSVRDGNNNECLNDNLFTKLDIISKDIGTWVKSLEVDYVVSLSLTQANVDDRFCEAFGREQISDLVLVVEENYREIIGMATAQAKREQELISSISAEIVKFKMLS